MRSSRDGAGRRQEGRPAPQALLVVGFGGPERREDVIPFLENVTRGKRVPMERLQHVAEHYYRFGGVSPINAQVRDLLRALEPELGRRDLLIPVYWGNRNWHPYLPETLDRMASDGVRSAVALVLSAYGSYSGCRQYREDIERARREAGLRAPAVEKIRLFYNHPGFVAANAARVEEVLASLPERRRAAIPVAFSAHSIPRAMADAGPYERQLQETCRLIAEELSIGQDRWRLVYQSRSGRPQDPWLEPDVGDHLRALRGLGAEEALVHPVGFLSDHMEVLYDLDVEARETAESLGLRLLRSRTVGTHPRFVSALADLVEERLRPSTSPKAVGLHDPPGACDPDCCRPASPGPDRAPASA